ncbi:hypothetical protein [Roseiterribacter gracilis]
MSRRRKRAEADIRVLLEAWHSLRADGEDVPLWSKFDPVLCFPHLVGHLFVLALEPSGSWRVRLVGSSLRGALTNGAGKLMEEIYPPHVMQIFTPRLAELATKRRPMQIRQASAYDRVLHSLGVVLPFHQGDFLVTRIASATFYLDEFHPAGPLHAMSSEVETPAHDLVE